MCVYHTCVYKDNLILNVVYCRPIVLSTTEITYPLRLSMKVF